MSNNAAEAKHTKNAAASRVTVGESQWNGFEELDKAESQDTKRASEMTHVEMDTSNVKLKPKERRNKERKTVVCKQAPSKSLENPFDALAKVDDNTGDADVEVDGKRVRVPIGNNAY